MRRSENSHQLVVACTYTSHVLHMGNRHTEDGQLVRFSGERATSRDHITEFVDVDGHFVASSAFNLAVALPRS